MESHKHHYHREHIRLRKLFIVLIFLAIALYIAYIAFFPNASLTGKAIDNLEEDGVHITSNLTAPELVLDGEFDKVEIKGGGNAILYVGGGRFDLGGLQADITLMNYDGKLNFDSRNILQLNGKATRVLINDLPISPQSGDTMKVFINENLGHNFIKITDVHVKEITYQTSGLISVNRGKAVINVDNEEVSIGNFVGDLTVENNKLGLDGYLAKLDVAGESHLSVAS